MGWDNGLVVAALAPGQGQALKIGDDGDGDL